MLVLSMTLALAAEPPAAEAPQGLDEVSRELSHRHAQPCEELEALTPTPVATLRYVVSNVTMPPWAPMRAAECLQRNHAEAVREDLIAWVSDPALKGLGRQTVALIDVLPTPLAVDVGRAALLGPVADRAELALPKDLRPEVRGLVGPGVTP
jgi:hypothetical protein